MHPRNGFHILYAPNSSTPITCERVDWKTCPEHKHLSPKRTVKNSKTINDKDLQSNITETESVTLDEYNTGLSVESILQEATERKGTLLTKEEAQVAAILGQWYEEGSLKPARGVGEIERKMHIQFNNNIPATKKGKKTIGVVQLGSEGFQYFYEVEGNQVSFRHADGIDPKTGKLPWNYSMRKKLDGKDIKETNQKWSTESYINGHGL